MDLKMEVYSPRLELLGLVEIQKSVIWERQAFSAGSFTVQSLLSDRSRDLLAEENIIWIADDTAGIIKHVKRSVDASGPYINVSGWDLTGILRYRVLSGPYDLSGTVPDIMRYLVDDCCIHPTRWDGEARRIPGLVLAEAEQAGPQESIRTQKTGGFLLEALEELGEAYGVAFGVRFNPQVPQMEFWCRPGVNRTVGQTVNEPVFYSTELDDVLSSEYSYDSSDYCNIALVAGEGKGKDRVMVTVAQEVQEPPAPPEPVKYTVTLSVDPEGGGLASGGGEVESGKNITVTASASAGYSFSGWQENGVIVSTSASYTFTVTGDRVLTAVFAVVVPTYTVTAAIDPEGSGTVTGAGVYSEGQTVTVTAEPEDGYNFAAWQENGETVSGEASYTFTADRDRQLVAVFAVIPASKLPEGYTELMYISCSYGQRINSGIVPTSKTRILMDLDNVDFLNPNNVNSSKFFFQSYYSTGTGTSASYYYLAMMGSNQSSKKVSAYMGRYTSSTLKVTTINGFQVNSHVKIDVDLASHSISVNETVTSVGSNGTTHTSMPSLMLFGIATGSTAAYSGIQADIYSCQIYDNEEIKRDYVPCTDPSGVAGLYDLVSETFFGSASATAFVAGPAL